MKNGEFLLHRSLRGGDDEIETRAVKEPAEQMVKNIRRATRKHSSAEEKIRTVLEGLRGAESIAELCRRDGLPPNVDSAGPRIS